MSYKYYITDVFGEEKYTGNQLATFTDASSIPPEEMQMNSGWVYGSFLLILVLMRTRQPGVVTDAWPLIC